MNHIVLTREDLEFDDNGKVIGCNDKFEEVLSKYVYDGLRNPSYYEYNPNEWIELDGGVTLVNLYKPNIRYHLINAYLSDFYGSNNMDWDSILCECLDYEQEVGVDYEDFDNEIWLSFRDSVIFNFDDEIHKEYYNRDEDIYESFKEIIVASIDEWNYNIYVNSELLVENMLKLVMEFCALIVGEIDEFVQSDGFNEMIFECFTMPYTEYMVKSILSDGEFVYYNPPLSIIVKC